MYVTLFCLLFALFNTSALAASNGDFQSFGATSLSKSDGSYWVWGAGQSVPIQIHDLSDVEKSFDCQFDRQLVMKKDGTVWFWERKDPSGEIQVHNVQSLNNLIDVQYKMGDLLALDQERKVYLLSTQGQLTSDRLNQITHLSGIDDVVDLGAYWDYHQQSHAEIWAFLKKDGTVWINKGDFPTEAFEPIPAPNNVIEIEENIALKQDGTVWYWPSQTKNDLSASITAAPITELTSIKKIKSYNKSYVAIDQNADLWFWGVTLTGASDGTIRHNQTVPVKLNSIKDVKDAFFVERSLIVLTKGGDVWEASIDRESMPENPVFNHLTSDVQEIKLGARHIMMQKNDASLWGWGVNKSGQLGSGDFEFMHLTPQRVQRPVAVYLNDEPIVMNSSGVIIRNDQAFIPLRSVFEKMGAAINWDTYTKTVTISQREPEKEPVTISINYSSGTVDLNNKPVTLSNQPFILVSTAYLPLRFISESLGGKVDWIQDEGKIFILMQ
ncbi:stalk domain-containing protein [Dehalobacterium formicoaceticum]|uniref:Stalk domain-containing protein n=1 Tax=Dehalobacterium formicoaceticum TaxID=51515 RepID=A0ABT1YA88_9FIRM|nr:stalk domain-containing protein [Dehalobacterium formicoaceticum]MCR6546566.1 stalk domain-containing protein [Dehalobacterium formicoaceticum]